VHIAAADQHDDVLALRAAGSGNAGDFEVLVRRHQSRVRGYLRYLTRDPAWADDLAQDTFLRAWNKLHTYSASGPFVAWLLRIAHHIFLRAWSKSRREAEKREQMAAQAWSEMHSQASGNTPGAGEWPDLDRYLAILSVHERAALVLAYAYGYSHSEISDVSGVPVGTVKSHIHRAKSKICTHFKLQEVLHARG